MGNRSRSLTREDSKHPLSSEESSLPSSGLLSSQFPYINWIYARKENFQLFRALIKYMCRTKIKHCSTCRMLASHLHLPWQIKVEMRLKTWKATGLFSFTSLGSYCRKTSLASKREYLINLKFPYQSATHQILVYLLCRQAISTNTL